MKIRCIAFLLTCFGGIVITNAQEIQPMAYTDSVEFLLTLAAEKPEHPTSLARAQRALRYAQEHNYRKGEAKAHYIFGRIYANTLRYNEAIESYVESSRIFEALHDDVNAGRALNSAATVYIYHLDHYAKAHEYCSRALILMKDDSVAMQPAIANMASLKLRMGKAEEAMKLYQLVYQYDRKLNRPSYMCRSLNNIATCYEVMKNYRQSIAYYEKALAISTALDDYKQSAHILLGLQSAYCQLNEHKKAYELMREAETIVVEHKLYEKHVTVLQGLSSESEHGGKISEAIAFAEDALHLADTNDLRVFMPGIAHQLSELYTKAGKPELALKYSQQHAVLNDSIAHAERMAVATMGIPQKNASSPESLLFEKTGVYQWLIVVLVLVTAPAAGLVYHRRKRSAINSPDVDRQSGEDSGSKGIESIDTKAVISSPELVHLEVINGQGMKLVALDDICWLQKDGKNYFVHTAKGIYRLRKNISEVEDTLPKDKFFRINRTVIINTTEMSNYSFWENHKYIIRMKDEKKSEFVISRNRLREMRASFLSEKATGH